MLLTDKDYETLRAFMDSLSRQYGVELHVGGPWEYGEGNGALQRFLLGYIIHQNPFCIYVKTNHTLWSHCVCVKQKLLKALEKGEVCGACHCGVMELAAPIRRGGEVIGFVSAGGFWPDERMLRRRLHAVSRRYGFDETELRRVYEAGFSTRPTPSPELRAAIGTLALLFSSVADNLPMQDASSGGSGIEGHLLCQRALEYLHVRYGKPIRIEDVARFCNCSQSHIQHLFRQAYGISVGAYLEGLRMDKACALLAETELPVRQVAARTGYTDANYFSTVFSRRKGLSPTAFRESRKQK